MANDKTYRNQSFPIDPREYDPYRGVTIFSDFNTQNSDWKFQKVTAGVGTAFADAAYQPTYGLNPTFANVVELKSANGILQDSRSRICDRATTDTATLKGGVAEMDFLVRAKWDRAASAGCQVFLGFFSDIVPSVGGSDPRNSVMFIAGSTDNVWSVQVTKDWDGTAGFRTKIATTAAIGDWNTFGIYLDKAGKDAVFTINGTIVHRRSTDIPTAFNQTIAAHCYSVGAELLAVNTITTVKTLTLDFMKFRYFHDRSL